MSFRSCALKRLDKKTFSSEAKNFGRINPTKTTKDNSRMGSMEPCMLPGFRFHPTDEELLGYYLWKKVTLQKIDLDLIRDIDLNRIEPWDIKERCRIGYQEQNELYFFSHKDKKYPTGERTNRATIAGFWKATGTDKAIYDKTRLIGMRKTLVFYKGRAPSGQKTDWIMHEYRLEANENGPPQEEGWVVCRAFKNRTTALTKNTQSWLDTGRYFGEEPSGMCSIIDPTECITQQEYLKSHFMCKPEIIADQALAADNLLFFNNPDDNFLQLPHLESPSVPLMKRSSSEEEANNVARKIKGRTVGNDSDSICRKRVTDWRALDNFVASQLSQEEKLYEGNGEPTMSLNESPSSDQDCMVAACLFAGE